MNADVRVALASDGTRHLVWITDADASLTTVDDRRITWASAPVGAPGDEPTWTVVNPQALPPRVDSPALSVGPAGLELPGAPARGGRHCAAAGTQRRRVDSNLRCRSMAVEFLISAPTADPALDPLSAPVSVLPAGWPLTVTVTVRNVGRDPATGMTVTLYEGMPGSGVLLGSRTVAGPLALNAGVPLTFSIAAQGGVQPLYAQVITAGGNASPTNDLTALTLGIPTALITLTVAPSPWEPESLEIAWSVSEAEQPAGYLVLRGATAGGPFELVGESAVASYVDNLVARGQTYCYVVQAHNGGTLSPVSGVNCGAVALLQVYLPVITR